MTVLEEREDGRRHTVVMDNSYSDPRLGSLRELRK